MTRILIIDDEAPVRKMLQEALNGEGYHVREAANGLEALRIQSDAPSDLIVIDMLMPHMEGIETIMEFPRRWPGVKVLAISGGSKKFGFDILYVAKQLGAADTLEKPFSLPQMLRAIRKISNAS
jgi:DNA-binding NtrC family response regulator